MLAQMQGVYKSYHGAYILEEIGFQLDEGDKVGMIGPNGAGKTTILRLLTGAEQADLGSVFVHPNCRVGMLTQTDALSSGNTVYEEMKHAFPKLLLLQEKIADLTDRLASVDPQTPEGARLTDALAEAQTDFEQNDGYLMEVHIAKVLTGLGFDKSRWDSVIDTLSGGEKTRIALARLLLVQPDLLILDEPTNHLDFSALFWLEDFLQTYPGSVLTVSHDRFFLDRLCNRIFEVEYGRLQSYPGNYTAYLGQKKQRYERQCKEYAQQQEKLADLKDYVARNMARASTAASARSRQKEIDKMELIEKPRPPKEAAKFSFVPRLQTGKEVLMAKNLTLKVGEGETQKTLFSGLNLSMLRGEKLALIGPNGVGKTSLLRGLQGLLPFETGQVVWGKNVRISYFEQEGRALVPENTAMEELWKHQPRKSPFEIRSALGKVQITGEHVQKKVGVLSGGEKARLTFAILTFEQGNVLLLDEPTNHLDLPTKESLEEALCAFEGSMIVVSHDRYLLSKLPTKIIELQPDGAKEYVGNYAAYLEVKSAAEGQLSARGVANEDAVVFTASREENAKKEAMPLAKRTGSRTKQDRALLAKMRQRKNQLEKMLEELEQEQKLLEEDISNPAAYEDYLAMNEKCARIEQIGQEQEQMLIELLTLEEQLQIPQE